MSCCMPLGIACYGKHAKSYVTEGEDNIENNASSGQTDYKDTHPS